MAAATQIQLSTNDALVLSAVFDPESNPLSSITSLVDASLPASLPNISASLLNILQTREGEILLPLNNASPSPELIKTALSQLTSLIAENQSYASAYNNRAQVLRLSLGDDLFSPELRDSSVWTDLGEAIRLATDPCSGGKVCVLQGRVLAAAYMQRGALILKASNKVDAYRVNGTDSADGIGKLPAALQGMDKMSLEEIASKDFEMAGRYGDVDALKMARVTNPYARLCGGIVGEAMKAELRALNEKNGFA
ncbi:hypothetical protein B7494_g605 [Chlorociboria aeruginascens]|nr:hypothetical protein B7494_g605 [Chlorociboria aeruginascens]